MKKALFKFKKDGEVYTDPNLGEWDAEFTQKMLAARERHYSAQIPIEREWRNREFASVSWVFEPEATSGGVEIAGSHLMEEVLAYRRQLREYNLTTDERPTKPEWL